MRSSLLKYLLILCVSCNSLNYGKQKKQPIFGTYKAKLREYEKILKLNKSGSYEYLRPNLYYINSFSRGSWSIKNDKLIIKDSLIFTKLNMEVTKADSNKSTTLIKINYSETYYTSSYPLIEFWDKEVHKVKELSVENQFNHLDSFRFLFYIRNSDGPPIQTITYFPLGGGLYTVTLEPVNFDFRNIGIETFQISYNVLSKPSLISRYNDIFYYIGN